MSSEGFQAAPTGAATATLDERSFRRARLLAFVTVPYLACYVWYVVAATLSATGHWPHWPRHPLGYYPEDGPAGAVAGVVVLSFWCIPVPLIALCAALSSCWTGYRLAP
jgi:hypothetical protein